MDRKLHIATLMLGLIALTSAGSECGFTCVSDPDCPSDCGYCVYISGTPDPVCNYFPKHTNASQVT